MPDSTWQVSYRAALVESDPIKLPGRIEAADGRFAISWSRSISAMHVSVGNCRMRSVFCSPSPQESDLPEFEGS